MRGTVHRFRFLLFKWDRHGPVLLSGSMSHRGRASGQVQAAYGYYPGQASFLFWWMKLEEWARSCWNGPFLVSEVVFEASANG